MEEEREGEAVNLITVKWRSDEDGGELEVVVQSTASSLEEVYKTFKKVFKLLEEKSKAKEKDLAVV